jgi:hypothetical protein
MINAIVTTEPDTHPPLWRVRASLADALGLQGVAATLRWRERNASQEPVCHCGAPGTVRITDSGPIMGSVRPYWWRCDEHAAIPLTVPWANGRPLIGESPESCSWRSSQYGTVIECGCGEHVGEPM